MRALFVAGVIGVAACAHGPTTQLTPRDATIVNAPFDRTWNAVIDVFAARNISIATIDRSSGLIATKALAVNAPEDTVRTWIDCGDAWHAYRRASVEYNVLVRGDGVRSTVKVTATWSFVGITLAMTEKKGDCVTKHVWEQGAEADIKARAERPTTTSVR